MAVSKLWPCCVIADVGIFCIAGCSTSGPSGGITSTPVVPAAAKAQLAYVGGNSGEIYGFTVSSTGVWTPTSPAYVSTGDTFGAMTIDPLGKFVFFAGFLNGNISSYSITPETGTLTSVGTAAASNSNNRPENMTIDPTGRFLYVANTGLNTVSTYTINRTTGTLTAGVDTTLPGSPGFVGNFTSPSGIVIDSTGKYLYVAEYGYIVCFSIDQTTGTLTTLATPTVLGTDYFTLRLDQTGKYLYGTSGRSNYVFAYSITASTGELKALSSVPTGNGATDIGITNDDSHAYVIDRDDQTISLFSLNDTTGGLTPLTPATITYLGAPYIIQMDPGGQLAYVINESGGIESYRIDSDGTLSEYNGTGISDSPVGLAIYPSH